MNDMRYTPRNTPGRGEADAAAIVGMLAIGVLSTMIALVIGVRFLESVPPIFAAAVVFSLLVFAIMCGAAFLRRDTRTMAHQPPVLAMRRPRSVRIR